jgi:aminopeptidase N
MPSSLHARCACAGAASPRPFAFAGTRRVYERARPFHIRHLTLELRLDVAEKSVAGSATLDFERIDAAATELTLDAVGFEIESVELGPTRWTKSPYVYDGNTITIPVPAARASASVRVRYRAVPERGLYFLAPDEHVKDRPRQVWSQCQDEDGRFWFPCHDKPHLKMSFDLDVTVPKGWYALSNGQLAERKTPPGAKSWRYRWQMKDPLPSYLVTLVAGEFAEIDATPKGGVPVTYLVPKGREADGRRSFARTPEMIENFGKLFGVPYPWNKYAQVVVSDFIFGGMENTTATTMYEHVLLDERAALDITSDDIIAHELAHQWFGDYVTCRDWSHGWLNEGFATFAQHLDLEKKVGKDEYDYSVKGDLDSYLGEANSRYRRPIVCQDYEAPIEVFDRHLYEKGGLVLHMLRRLLGDETFFRAVRGYLTRHARSIVETRDLMRALEDVSGRGLEQFFEQWLTRAGHPELEVKLDHEGRVLTMSVKQTQKIDKETPAFAFPLTVEITTAKGKVIRHTSQIEKQAEAMAIPCPERPAFVVVDPDFAVLADLRVDAPEDMLTRQLVNASTARGRWLAAAPLGKRADVSALSALAKTLANEKEFWGTRAEAAEALGGTRLEAAFGHLVAGAKTKHPKVRRAVMRALGRFRTPEAAKALIPFALEDESYLVEAEAARALGGTRQAQVVFDTLIEILDRPSWGDVIRIGALDGLSALRDDRALPHVLSLTRYGTKSRGRRAAILALAKLTSERKYREAIEDLLDDRDPIVRHDVVRALAEMGEAKSKAALSRRLEREPDGRVRRRIREALQEIGAHAREQNQELKDEIDKLKREQAELSAKVKKLEATLEPRKK